REAQLMKIPYMLVIGDKEQEDGTVAVRRRDGTATEVMKAEDFAEMIAKEIKDRA
ncbi:MAG: hypothetical protein J6S70_05175, partial [Clostridia bacterium]|nr:hypothetical protein [Clostridia bacterium]